MPRVIPLLIGLAIFAMACGGGSDSDTKEVEPPKTPEETVERFLSLWQERNTPRCTHSSPVRPSWT